VHVGGSTRDVMSATLTSEVRTIWTNCTSTPHAQHEGAQHGHAQHGHAQQAHATRARGARTTRVCTQRGLAQDGGKRDRSESSHRDKMWANGMYDVD